MKLLRFAETAIRQSRGFGARPISLSGRSAEAKRQAPCFVGRSGAKAQSRGFGARLVSLPDQNAEAKRQASCFVGQRRVKAGEGRNFHGKEKSV